MDFLPVILWSDVLIWMLVVGVLGSGWLSASNPLLRAAWRRVGRSRAGMASATILLAFVCGFFLPAWISLMRRSVNRWQRTIVLSGSVESISA